MPDDPTTAGDDATPFGAWVLRASGQEVDVDAVLARFGQVYRLPITPSERADQLDAGQPCVLIRTDRSKVVGIWAIGEVVARCLALPEGTDLLPGEVPLGSQVAPDRARCYAEVELLPLAKPIALDKVRGNDVLARSEVFTASDLADPLVLTPAEVRAVESFEFWIEPPSDEQRSALDRLLASEDDLIDQL